MLNAFTAHRRDVAEVRSSVDDVWDLLVQPSVLVRHTPFLHSIDDLGDGRWRWQVGGIPYPGGHFTTGFTERMTFDPPRRIDFRHEPATRRELAGADGHYELTPGSGPLGRTTLEIELDITAKLPAPRAGRRVVVGAMDLVIGQMGRSFAAGLLADLGER